MLYTVKGEDSDEREMNKPYVVSIKLTYLL